MSAQLFGGLSNKRQTDKKSRKTTKLRQSVRLQNVAATDRIEDMNMEGEAEEDVRSQNADEDNDQGPLTSRDENPIEMSALDSASRPRATQAERPQAVINPNLTQSSSPTPLVTENTDKTHDERVREARLELLRNASLKDTNESKLRAGLRVFQAQSAAQNTMSLDDPALLAVGLTDSQLDICIDMFRAFPRAPRSEDKTSPFNIPTLGINFTKKDAMTLVSFGDTTTREIPVSQVVDEFAKFTIGNKLVSMCRQFDKEPMFFDNWF